jgi:eukaryotic-like serine/threonine-protein kinase
VSDAAETTVAARPAWARPSRERPTWGLEPGDAIATGRTVLSRLGGGTRYEVFLVWDEHHLAVLVAKVLRPDQATDPAALRDLTREVGALSSLAHPVVVRCFDAVLDGRLPHLLIEHLEGPTLHTLLEDGDRPALEQVLPLGLHVASALHYMAAEGWVHLDVKPDNVVMGTPPRLIDLSVARTLARARRLAGPTGTDAYMAPEQCRAGRDGGPVGPPADVWGLGATLHHAVSGAPPFPRPPGARRSPDREARFPQLVRAPEPLPRRTPPALADIVAACLAPRPADRPTAAEVAAALEPLVLALPRGLVLPRR